LNTLWYIYLLLGNEREINNQKTPLLDSGPGATTEVLLEAVFSMWPVPRLYHATDRVQSITRVEAGSNTSTVTQRVVEGDEKGSLKSETVKYGRESQETRTRD
jgi:hypothetical protein